MFARCNEITIDCPYHQPVASHLTSSFSSSFAGHGFGLPHTDESFWNRDLGNCLDYTNNYQGNESPDTSNYNYLTDLYGTVDGSIPPGTGIGATESSAAAASSSAEAVAGGGGRQRRALRRTTKSNRPHRQLFHAVESESRRRELQSRWDAIDEVFYNKQRTRSLLVDGREGWRILHRTEHGEAHEIDLGDGYVAQIHVLLA